MAKTKEKAHDWLHRAALSFWREDSVSEASMDALAWDLAALLCRQCWQPWWKHGHGPFASIIDEPVDHLFDAL